MKKCSKCSINKELIFFYKKSSSKDGYTSGCIGCNKKSQELYRKNNRETLRENNKIYERNNKEKAIKRSEKWYENNKEKAIEKTKKWREENKDKRAKQAKQHRLKNPHIYAWRTILTDCLKRFGKNKEGHTVDLLKYSAVDLKKHIELLFTEGMSWDNYGKWHIDHIKMVSEFDKNTPPYIVNELSNLRPLWATTRKINGVIYEGNLNRNKKLRK